MSQIKYLVHAILSVSVDANIARDLGQGQHIAARAELQVHHVLVQVDVGRLLHQSACILHKGRVGARRKLLASVTCTSGIGFYHFSAFDFLIMSCSQ